MYSIYIIYIVYIVYIYIHIYIMLQHEEPWMKKNEEDIPMKHHDGAEICKLD